MSRNQIEFPQIMQLISNVFLLGFKSGRTTIPNITFNTFSSNVESTSNKEISVKKDSKKEYIEFDMNKMKPDKLYFIEYGNMPYAIRKIGNDQVVFYDVVE